MRFNRLTADRIHISPRRSSCINGASVNKYFKKKSNTHSLLGTWPTFCLSLAALLVRATFPSSKAPASVSLCVSVLLRLLLFL